MTVARIEQVSARHRPRYLSMPYFFHKERPQIQDFLIARVASLSKYPLNFFMKLTTHISIDLLSEFLLELFNGVIDFLDILLSHSLLVHPKLLDLA
jgi:hypothetical protein